MDIFSEKDKSLENERRIEIGNEKNYDSRWWTWLERDDR
jgi:hypothetical protein